MSVHVIHTKPGEKIVTYFCTRNLYDVLPAAYNSLLAYSPDVHVYCFIEDDKLPYKIPKQVTTVNVIGQDYFSESGPNYYTKYTYMILLKAALTKIFPDADKAVILDVDTIVYDDISPLWQWDLSHAYYAAVVEPQGSGMRGVPYANFGLVLLNLSRLRSSGKDDEIIDLLNTHKFSYPEQDAFSHVCMNRFDPLPPDYNVTSPGFNITGKANRTIVRHFAGFHDWRDFDIVRYWMTNTVRPPRYVVYAGNRDVYYMMDFAAKSLLHHTQVDKIFFLIEDDAFTHPLPEQIQCINVSNQTIFPSDGPNITPYYTYMTTLRAGLTKLLPSYVDTVLWLDPDTIVCEDIRDIWSYDIQHYYFAAVEEVRNHNHSKRPYFNAGVMLMNLAKFRTDGMDDTVINVINRTRYEHLEQDALNFVCDKHILSIPSCWSDSFVSAPCDHPKIKHFVSHAKPQLRQASEPYRMTEWKDIRYATMKAGDNK